LEWLEDKGVEKIQVLDIHSVSVDMDTFVIGTASNERLAGAAADNLIEKCKENNIQVRGVEGQQVGKWILIDLVDTIVHIFQKDERERYNLEKLWSDGVNITTIRPENE